VDFKFNKIIPTGNPIVEILGTLGFHQLKASFEI